MAVVDLVINDESEINDRGYSVLNAGLDSVRYYKNPVMLYQHDLERVIGRCVGTRVDGVKLIGSFEFDEADPVAAEVKRKVDAGFLRGVSAGFYIAEMEVINERLCVTQWELLEVSIVTIPSNRSAVCLYSKEGVKLSDEETTALLQQLSSKAKTYLDMSKQEQNQPTQSPALAAEALAALGLAISATPDEISSAIVELAARAKGLETQVETERVAQRDAYLKAAQLAGKITEEKMKEFEKLYDADKQLCCAILDAIPGATPVPSVPNAQPSLTERLNAQKPVENLSAAPKGFEGEWKELDKKGKLIALKAQHPDYFRELYKATFQAEYKG